MDYHNIIQRGHDVLGSFEVEPQFALFDDRSESVPELYPKSLCHSFPS